MAAGPRLGTSSVAIEALIGAADPVGEARARSTPVASFGDDADTITVRRVVTDPDEIATARREQVGRIAAGQALTANPRLGLAPKAANLISTRPGGLPGAWPCWPR